MKPITFEDTLAFADYQRIRTLLRPLLIHEKDRRRLSVGSHLTLLFENAQTVWYQVQEMIRSEQMTSREAIQHELDTYNAMLPSSDSLSATLLIEYAEVAERDAALRRLVGMENHLWLVLGDRRERAVFDTRQMESERISSVQFVRFPLGKTDVPGFAELVRADAVAIECDHPSLAARAPIDGLLGASLIEDLAA